MLAEVSVTRLHLGRAGLHARLARPHQHLIQHLRAGLAILVRDRQLEVLAEGVGAGRVENLVATVKDVGYLMKKTRICSIYATEADLGMAESAAPTDTSLHVLKRSFVSTDYLLNRCETLHDFAAVLHSHLVHLDALSDLCRALEQELPGPRYTFSEP